VFAFDVGVGFTTSAGNAGKHLDGAEARYHRIFMSNYLHADYMPVSFGFRW
jgi:hypothetical protein